MQLCAKNCKAISIYQSWKNPWRDKKITFLGKTSESFIWIISMEIFFLSFYPKCIKTRWKAVNFWFCSENFSLLCLAKNHETKEVFCKLIEIGQFKWVSRFYFRYQMPGFQCMREITITHSAHTVEHSKKNARVQSQNCRSGWKNRSDHFYEIRFNLVFWYWKCFWLSVEGEKATDWTQFATVACCLWIMNCTNVN